MNKIKSFRNFVSESEEATFEFDELSPEAKQRAIEGYREKDYPMDDLSLDEIIENFKSELEEIGIHDADIRYTGFYRQGDGLSFTTDNIDTRKFLTFSGIEPEALDLKTDEDKEKESKFYDLIDTLDSIGQHESNQISPEDIEILISRRSNSYAHSNTVSAEVYVLDEPEGWEEPANFIYDLEIQITQFVKNLCDEFYKRLEKEWEHITSDESISDFLSNSSWEFDEEGNEI